MTDTRNRSDVEGHGGGSDRPPREASVVADHLGERGYTVERSEDRAAPAYLLDAVGEEPEFGPRVAVDALASADPTVVVDTVGAAAKAGRFALLAADPVTASAARAVLTDPPGVRAVDADGNRTFYNVPDRLRVGERGFGAVRADGDLRWREAPSEDGVTGADGTRIVLEADGRAHAAFDGYAALACPTPEAFPYAYRRGADKRVHVVDRDGDEVGVYSSIRAMKRNAYRPVPDPLVPEIHLPDGAELAGRWAIAVVEDGHVVEILTD